MQLTFRADPSTTEWLSEKDAVLCVEILRALGRPAPRVLEVGVWKGAWTVTVAGNVADSVHLGIDPYPNGGVALAAKAQALAEVERHGLAARVRLVESWEAMLALADRPERFDLIHIDGRHTQDAVEHDLGHADEVLADDGVIVVDDFRNADFPGVSFAMYRFLERRDYRIFLTTENKAYLARTASVGRWHAAMERRLSAQQTIAWRHHMAAGPNRAPSTIAPPDVLGCPILLCLAEPTQVSRGSAGVVPAKVRVARVLRDWLPPIALRALLRLRERLR